MRGTAQTESPGQVFAFTLYGKPATAKGVQACVINGKPRTYKPTEVRDWQALVIAQMALHKFPSLSGPVGVQMVCRFKRTKKFPKRGKPHTVKPDLDNVYGRIMDAIEKGPGLFERDQQITEVILSKTYAGPGEPTSIDITVWCKGGETGLHRREV